MDVPLVFRVSRAGQPGSRRRRQPPQLPRRVGASPDAERGREDHAHPVPAGDAGRHPEL